MSAQHHHQQHDSHLIDGYRATMYAHCGMSWQLADTSELADVRRAVAAFLRARRAEGYAVSVISPGSVFETTEPEDSALVPDDAGVLYITAVYAKTVDCWHCGCAVRAGYSCDCQEDRYNDRHNDDDNDREEI